MFKSMIFYNSFSYIVVLTGDVENKCENFNRSESVYRYIKSVPIVTNLLRLALVYENWCYIRRFCRMDKKQLRVEFI